MVAQTWQQLNALMALGCGRDDTAGLLGYSNPFNARELEMTIAAGRRVCRAPGDGPRLTALGMWRELGMKKPEVAVVDIRPLDGNLLEQRFVLQPAGDQSQQRGDPIEGLTFPPRSQRPAVCHRRQQQAGGHPASGRRVVEVTATTGLGCLRCASSGSWPSCATKAEYRLLHGRLVTGNFGGFDFDETGEVGLPKGFGEARGGSRVRQWRSFRRWRAAVPCPDCIGVSDTIRDARRCAAGWSCPRR